MTEYFNRLLLEATLAILIPALILFLIGVLLIYVLWTAQKRADFDLAQFLQDDAGKYSALRAWGFICLGVHSWWIATLVFQKLSTETHFLYYGMIWAGTPVMMEFAKRWSGNLPLAQAQPAPPPVPPQQ